MTGYPWCPVYRVSGLPWYYCMYLLLFSVNDRDMKKCGIEDETIASSRAGAVRKHIYWSLEPSLNRDTGVNMFQYYVRSRYVKMSAPHVHRNIL